MVKGEKAHAGGSRDQITSPRMSVWGYNSAQVSRSEQAGLNEEVYFVSSSQHSTLKVRQDRPTVRWVKRGTDVQIKIGPTNPATALRASSRASWWIK